MFRPRFEWVCCQWPSRLTLAEWGRGCQPVLRVPGNLWRAYLGEAVQVDRFKTRVERA